MTRNGDRKIKMFCAALVALFGAFGMALIAKGTADGCFSTFSTTLGMLIAAGMAGNVGEHFAKRGTATPAEGAEK